MIEKRKEMGLVDFIEFFNDENKCRELLFSKRFPNGFVCPRCGSIDNSYLNNRNLYQCSDCRYQCSVTSGTVMHRTHIPLSKWFLAMYLISQDKRGYSAVYLSKELRVTYKTAWFLLQRIRSAMGERDSEYLLSGIVEVDDTYFGGKKKGSKRGRGTAKSKVLVAVSKNNEGNPLYLKMEVVKDLKRKTIKKFSSQNIALGSIIQTDGYHTYRGLSIENFKHEYEIFDPESKWLHWLHILIGNAKAFVNGTFHGLNEKHLQLYLNEYCYRFNRRYMKDSIFERLLQASAYARPLSLSELTG